MTTPLLTIETLAPDPIFVAIDGTDYELARPEDFGLREEAENARLLRKAARVLDRVEASKRETLTPKLEKELTALLDDFIAVILRAPAPVRKRLRFRQQMAIVQLFTTAVSVAATTSQVRRSRSTSARSPRSSARRTARATGSRSRSASSRPS